MEIKTLSRLQKTATDAAMDIHNQVMDLSLKDSHEAKAKKAILQAQFYTWSIMVGHVCRAIEEFKSNCPHQNNYQMSYMGGKVIRFHCDDCGYARRVIKEEAE